MAEDFEEKSLEFDPQAYLADVLAKLVNLWPASRLDDLLPWIWARAP